MWESNKRKAKIEINFKIRAKNFEYFFSIKGLKKIFFITNSLG